MAGFIKILVLVSSFSFFIYGMAYFITSAMKSEFKRFGLEKLGILTALLELTGATGLIVGLFINSILLVSSAGLAFLMLCGVAVRLKMRDNILVSLPALFYMILNSFIFYKSIHF